MVNCPNCGTRQTNAEKNWTITQTQQDAVLITETQLGGVYECPNCKATFEPELQTPVQTATEALEPTVSELVARLLDIRLGLQRNAENLRRNIEVFEAKRKLEFEAFQIEADSRASVLEEDITRLREEIRGLRDILGLNKKSN